MCYRMLDLYNGFFSNISIEIRDWEKQNNQIYPLSEVVKMVQNKKLQTKRILLSTQFTGDLESYDKIDLQLNVDNIKENSFRVCTPLMEHEGNKTRRRRNKAMLELRSERQIFSTAEWKRVAPN